MTDSSERNEDKLERVLRLYGTAVRAEADERFAARRDQMIFRALRTRRLSLFESITRGFGEILDPRFAGGMAAGVTAAIALLVVYNPNQPAGFIRANKTMEAGAVLGGENSRSKEVKFDRMSSDRQFPDRVKIEQVGADDFNDGEMAMNDLLGAFTPPVENGFDVAAIWPESDDSVIDRGRGITQPQLIDRKTKQEEDELEEFYLDDDQTA